ncbi:MAG: hypothetical protein ABF271_04650 [Abyssibacter sp.]|uniref:hypothetical protein n=1 Tax=Abyssibacter sp. TaxID=2320200 RepID=UPI002EA989BC|nr:hypothetical protein [Pseudomonadota bacterium]
MTQDPSLHDDLNYVARVVRGQSVNRGVPAIYYLWAVLIGIGFSLPDFAPQFAGLFWAIAGPGGGLLSWYLGARAERRSGATDRAQGARYGYHWLICGAGFVLAGIPGAEGLSGAAFGQAMLLVATLAYGLAALHLDRGLALPAVLLGAGYLVIKLALLPYAWTLTAVLIAISLVISGRRAAA